MENATSPAATVEGATLLLKANETDMPDRQRHHKPTPMEVDEKTENNSPTESAANSTVADEDRSETMTETLNAAQEPAEAIEKTRPTQSGNQITEGPAESTSEEPSATPSSEQQQQPQQMNATNGSSDEHKSCVPPTTESPPVDDEDANWNTVGIFRGLSANVTSYIDKNVFSTYGLSLDSDNLPDLSNMLRINLEPGTGYRFRLRAINSCGASEWSEVATFKTCMLGYPGAPSTIKISKSHEGAHLTWEPPNGCANSYDITEYSVYLAIKPSKEREAKMAATPTPPGARTSTQLAFIRVYVGQLNNCIVSTAILANAHVDTTTKPAIIFRIAARNDKGYGPATQVRWLQDSASSTKAAPSPSAAQNAAAAATATASAEKFPIASTPEQPKSMGSGAEPSRNVVQQSESSNKDSHSKRLKAHSSDATDE